MASGVSSSVPNVSGAAVGASFTGETLTTPLAKVHLPSGSHTS